MGILDRFSTLIRANVNDALDRAEDPVKMIDQILRDMQENIAEGRRQVATMIAQEKSLESDLATVRKLASEWQAKAGRAVAAGRDDLAREALRRKRDNDENAAVYEQQLASQTQTVDKLKQQLQQLEAKYQNTLSQRDALIARHKRASAQAQVASSLSAFSPLDPTSDLDRMERKIRGIEAHAAATAEIAESSLDNQFAALEDDLDIEVELAALKGGQAAALPPTTGADSSSSTQN
jgi:phage shock protein A